MFVDQNLILAATCKQIVGKGVDAPLYGIMQVKTPKI